MLSPGIIIPFDGDNSNIPSGFTRKTELDGLYIKLATSGIGATGGSATHTHTSDSHTHTYINNSHTHTTGQITGASIADSNTGHKDSPDYVFTYSNHTHGSLTSGTMTNAAITPASITVTAVDNLYSKYDLIFIESEAYNFYPVGTVALRDDVADREGASHLDAADGKFLKGAETGANAGEATTVATHQHATTHTHTLSHSHGSKTSSAVVTGLMGTNYTGSVTTSDHKHTVYFGTTNINVTDTTPTSEYTNDLLHRKLHLWKFTVKSLPQPGDIAFLLGDTIPNGWVDLGLDGYYVKGQTRGEKTASAGSNTHTHTQYTHSHATPAHTHTWTTSTKTADRRTYDREGQGANGSHSHSGTTSSSSSGPSTGVTSATFSEENHEPEYIKVRAIKLQYQVGNGGSVIPRFL